MKKRLLSALCAVMLLVCAVPMASAQSGDDSRMADEPISRMSRHFPA